MGQCFQAVRSGKEDISFGYRPLNAKKNIFAISRFSVLGQSLLGVINSKEALSPGYPLNVNSQDFLSRDSLI